MRRIFGITDAILSLAPNTQWVLSGDEFEGLDWQSDPALKPTLEQIEEEIVRLQAEYDNMEYYRSRSEEYPDFREYLDGVVKGDQDQIQAYIDACLAVKAKYPKPE
jgi:hypothetical protein